MNYAGIPVELRERDQWVCWRTEERDGKDTKVPLKPDGTGYADVTDSSTWTGYEPALEYYQDLGSVDGLGFVFTENDPYVGVDLDDCRNRETGAMPDLARELITRLDSYTEVSPSGTGVHVILEGTVPDSGNRRGSVEIYDTARFFTMTGDHVDGTPEQIERRGEALVAVHATYIARDEDGDSGGSSEAVKESYADLEDETLVARAMDAQNGAKFERLWNGDISGYTSHSEADLALCNMLAFWCGGDQQRIEYLFNQSGLVREKWLDRADYREQTIRNAVQSVSDFYGQAKTEAGVDDRIPAEEELNQSQ